MRYKTYTKLYHNLRITNGKRILIWFSGSDGGGSGEGCGGGRQEIEEPQGM